MNSLQNLIDEFNSSKATIKKQIESAESKITRLQAKIKKLESKWPYVIQNVLVPLANEIKSRTGLKYFEIYGPFGVEGETTIYFSNHGRDGDIKICEVETYHITIEYSYNENNELDHLVYWTGETTNRFPKGTIGELNGLNNVYAPLPTDIDEIIKLLRHSNH